MQAASQQEFNEDFSPAAVTPTVQNMQFECFFSQIFKKLREVSGVTAENFIVCIFVMSAIVEIVNEWN